MFGYTKAQLDRKVEKAVNEEHAKMITERTREVGDLVSKHGIEVRELKAAHAIEMKQKEFDASQTKKLHEAEVKELKTNNDLPIRELKAAHAIEIREKDFKLEHVVDVRVAQADERSVGLEKDVAVLRKENEMLGKITDLNSDVIDVKELVGSLIEKLPEIRLTALPGGATAKPEKGGGGDKGGKQE